LLHYDGTSAGRCKRAPRLVGRRAGRQDRQMNVTPQEVKAMQDRGESFRLIDVREQDEWNTGRIDGAELIPLSQFQQRATGELDPADKIVLYCHHGMRSARAQGFLQAHGYGDVLNLTGGIDAWAVQVDPKVPRY
jgi:rhodanese-related sulfurtransferase